MATLMGRAMQKLVLGARALKPPRPVPRCLSLQARSEHDVRSLAMKLAGGPVGADTLQNLLRDLVALNTPALFLNIRHEVPRMNVMLRPWDGRSIRFRGPSFMVDAGSEAPEGVEAFAIAPFSHVTALYPTTPDHPVYVISIEYQDQSLITGEVPAYLTHVTILVNGVLLAHRERLLHERGPQVWAA